MNGYISFVAARRTQSEVLGEHVLPHLRRQVGELAAQGVLSGPGPIFTGIGASLAAAAAGVWRLRSRGVDAWRLSAGDNPLPLPSTTTPVFGISQSGRSTETIAALESIERPRRTVIVNSDRSPMNDLSDTVINVGSVADSYASTVGFTATALAIALIAEAWNGAAPDPTWETLPAVIACTREELAASIADAALLFEGATHADFVAEGASLGSAEVGALLFREVARIPTTSFGTRQYLHGAMESASDGVHVIMGADREAAAADMLAAAGHKVVFMTDATARTSSAVRVIRLPFTTPAQRSLIEAVVLQDLVERVAALRDVEIEEFVFHHDDTKLMTETDA